MLFKERCLQLLETLPLTSETGDNLTARDMPSVQR